MFPMRHRAVAAALFLASQAMIGPIGLPAFAAGGDRALALDLFEQGRRLLQNGDCAGALAKFEAAATNMRTFGILFNIAECDEKLGRTASAWATWREAAAVASQANNTDDQALATGRQKALEPKLSRLTLIVPSDAEAPGLEVQRDDEVIPRAAWGSAIPIDPGAHAIVARAPGRTAKRIVIDVAPDGASPSVTLTALDVSPAPPAPIAPALASPPQPAPIPPAPASPASPSPSSPATPSMDSGSVQRTAGWVLAGVGLVGAGVGIAVALNGQGQHNDAVATDLAGNPSQAEDMESTANKTKTIGYVTIGSGGAFLVSGLVLVLTAPSSARAPTGASWRPWVSSAAAGGSFSTTW
jgi:hypothetical protein